MKIRIEVTYKAEIINKEVDDKITKAMKKIGAKWYAQGYDLQKKVRDICFDLNIKEVEDARENGAEIKGAGEKEGV